MKEAFIDPILQFWFEEITPKDWFVKNPEFDDLLKTRFGDLVEDATGGRLDIWAKTKEGRLALILLLDQMTRNIYRDTPKAFSGDEMALAMSLRAVNDGFLEDGQSKKNQFFLMPMMHCELIDIQEQSIPLFERYTIDEVAEFAKKHRDIIARFGHFPHRNAVLGRPSTAEEIAFLKTPGSSF